MLLAMANWVAGSSSKTIPPVPKLASGEPTPVGGVAVLMKRMPITSSSDGKPSVLLMAPGLRRTV